MDDTQKDQSEEQKLQQVQGSNPSSGTAPVGQTNLSADYSAVDSGQQEDTASNDLASSDEEQPVISTDQSDNDGQNSQGIEQESTEQNEDESSVMNDFSEEHIDDEIDSGDEEDVETADEEEVEEPEEPGSTDETTGEQAESGVVVGDGGNLAEIPNDSSAVGDGGQGVDSITDSDSGLSGEVPAPDLTPETDATPVEEVIDGAFADFNSGNADAGDVLSGGTEE